MVRWDVHVRNDVFLQLVEVLQDPKRGYSMNTFLMVCSLMCVMVDIHGTLLIILQMRPFNVCWTLHRALEDNNQYQSDVVVPECEGKGGCLSDDTPIRHERDSRKLCKFRCEADGLDVSLGLMLQHSINVNADAVCASGRPKGCVPVKVGNI